MTDQKLTFLEFFAGGGMARAGLGEPWRCAFANDFDPMKVAAYVANYGPDDIRLGDVASLTLDDLPAKAADLVWASFPCQDISVAGKGHGIGAESDETRTRSGAFWPFWKLIVGLVADGRAPRTIILENVYRLLKSRGGKDFTAIASALSRAGYRFGAVVIDAVHFVPQSRERVFVIAVRNDQVIPAGLVSAGPDVASHPSKLVDAYDMLVDEVREHWLWWNLPMPAQRNTALEDLIEGTPSGVKWHTAAETERLLSLMAPKHRADVDAAMKAGRRMVGAVYKRGRNKIQRAEVRFDGVAGCLRTASGGSSRQTLLFIDGPEVRSRLLSPREAARLMGLDDGYQLPPRFKDAYSICGDGVCVPVVRHIAQHILEPLLHAG